jgi:uncharacterized membrane-anchored protein
MRKCAAAFLFVLVSSVTVVSAQEPLPAGWMPGPAKGLLGNRATIAVPEGYIFLDVSATRKFLEENQNIPSGRELGTLLRLDAATDDYWFAVFTYADTGHVDDSDRDKLDAAAMLKSMREGEKESNADRQKRGWSPLTLQGWQRAPYYDTATNNLTWATRLNSDGETIINHSVRLLGRTGLMSAQLVASPNAIETATTEFNDALSGYSFNDGQRYAEFRKGDKLAGYGLTALIAGGAGAAAVKVGLFKKLWKFLVFLALAIVAALKKLFSSLGGREQTSTRPVPRVPEAFQRPTR